jgi:hypothetical protein
MRTRLVVALGGVLLLGGTAAFLMKAEPIVEAQTPAPIVFVCKNGVAMSVWSAAYFNRLAAARGLRQRAIARAMVPSYSAVPINMTLALALDGFRVDGFRPHVISADDIRTAESVIAIETDLPPSLRPSVPKTELWLGFPPMREQYFPSRAALKARVEALIERLAAAAPARYPAANPAQGEPAK